MCRALHCTLYTLIRFGEFGLLKETLTQRFDYSQTGPAAAGRLASYFHKLVTSSGSEQTCFRFYLMRLTFFGYEESRPLMIQGDEHPVAPPLADAWPSK